MPVTGRERQVQQSHQQTNIINVNSPNQRKKAVSVLHIVIHVLANKCKSVSTILSNLFSLS